MLSDKDICSPLCVFVSAFSHVGKVLQAIDARSLMRCDWVQTDVGIARFFKAFEAQDTGVSKLWSYFQVDDMLLMQVARSWYHSTKSCVI